MQRHRFCRDFVYIPMAFKGDSIYWVETEKIVPNPFQPRREFDESKLKELSESIRMYGVLQPLTVTRHEVQRDDGTFYSEYELIAGERRLRASRLAGIAQVPVIIREGEESEQEKLELAIIENLQREDLNAVDRALAFKQLAEQFELSHNEVAKKVGRSREYVSNSIRLLALPENILDALKRGEVNEGHARTLLMLNDRPEQQQVVFEETKLKKLSVRDVEKIAREIATEKVRKRDSDNFDLELISIQKKFTEALGTRVQIQKTEFGGRLAIDYFTKDDLQTLLDRMNAESSEKLTSPDNSHEKLSESTPLVTQPAVPQPQTPELHEKVSQEAVSPDKSAFTTHTNETNPAADHHIKETKTETEIEPEHEEMSAMKSILASLTANLHQEVDEPKNETANNTLAHSNEGVIESSREQVEITTNSAADSEEQSLESHAQPATEPAPVNQFADDEKQISEESTEDDSDLYSINRFSV